MSFPLTLSVQFSRSVVSDSLRPHGLQQARLSYPSPCSLLKLMSIKSVMSSNHLILCHPFLLLPSIFPSIKVSSNESVLCILWPKYWSFSFSISPSNEYSGLISFRIEWFDLLAVQRLWGKFFFLGEGAWWGESLLSSSFLLGTVMWWCCVWNGNISILWPSMRTKESKEQKEI